MSIKDSHLDGLIGRECHPNEMASRFLCIEVWGGRTPQFSQNPKFNKILYFVYKMHLPNTLVTNKELMTRS